MTTMVYYSRLCSRYGRRMLPHRFHERHLRKTIRTDGRKRRTRKRNRQSILILPIVTAAQLYTERHPDGNRNGNNWLRFHSSALIVMLVKQQRATQSLLKHTNILLSAGSSIFTTQRIPKFNIKIEPGSTFHLPPTPSSCSSGEDSEDAVVSRPPSPIYRKIGPRGVLHTHTTRQPINTPLISSQPVSNFLCFDQ